MNNNSSLSDPCLFFYPLFYVILVTHRLFVDIPRKPNRKSTQRSPSKALTRSRIAQLRGLNAHRKRTPPTRKAMPTTHLHTFTLSTTLRRSQPLSDTLTDDHTASTHARISTHAQARALCNLVANPHVHENPTHTHKRSAPQNPRNKGTRAPMRAHDYHTKPKPTSPRPVTFATPGGRIP